jgi:hypothetical protein
MNFRKSQPDLNNNKKTRNPEFSTRLLFLKK